MFDIGFPELLLVAVVVLLVLGPERLPEALRSAGLWIGRLQRSFNSVKTEIEREIGMDEIRRQLHNESVMAEMRKLEQDLKTNADPRLNGTLKGSTDDTPDSNSILPQDSLGLDTEADDASHEQAQTKPLADRANVALDKLDTTTDEPAREATGVEQLQRETAPVSEAKTETAAPNGKSDSDHEQRA